MTATIVRRSGRSSGRSAVLEPTVTPDAQRASILASGRSITCDQGAVYARLSRNPDGSYDGVDRQLLSCEAVAFRAGVVVTAVYTDDNLSAWKRGVRRPGWEAMFSAVDAGRHDAIVSYHSDRLARNGYDGERLLRAGENGLKLYTASGDYDLSEADQRFMFRVVAASSIKASDDTSRRVKAKRVSLTENGEMGGPLAYGFKATPAGRVIDPQEADVIREAARRILNGEGTGAIVNDFQDRGVTLKNGSPITPAAFRAMMLAPRMAGFTGGPENDGMGFPLKAGAILERETWEAVRAFLNSRRRGRPNSSRALLSGLVTCGRCGRPMLTNSVTIKGERRHVYRCSANLQGTGYHRASEEALEGAPARCGVAIYQDVVDELARLAVLEWQAEPTRAAALASSRADVDGRQAEAQAKLERLRAASESAMAKLISGEWDVQTHTAVDGPLSLQIRKAQAEVTEYEDQGRTGELDATALAAVWDSADVETQRRMVKAALAKITVAPRGASTGGTAGRVDITPR